MPHRRLQQNQHAHGVGLGMLGVIQRVFQELGGVIRAALFARQIAVLLGENLAQHRRVFGAFIGRNRQRG